MNAPVSSLGILPPAPWRLQPAFVRRQRTLGALIVLGAAGLAVLLYVLATDAAAILRDEAIHAGPNVRVAAKWSGRQMPGWKVFPVTTDGYVSFTHAGGAVEMGRLTLTTLAEFDVSKPLHVYHDPVDASRWTTNWSVEQATNRWLACGQLLLVFGGLSGFSIWIGVGAVARLRNARLVARDGVEEVGVLEHAEDRHRDGRVLATRYRVLVTGVDGQRRRFTVWYLAKQGRLVFLPNDRVLLLVGGQHGQLALVLRHDLWPILLTDEQLARACDILQRIDPTAGWRVAGGKGRLRLTCSLKQRRRGKRA